MTTTNITCSCSARSTLRRFPCARPTSCCSLHQSSHSLLHKFERKKKLRAMKVRSLTKRILNSEIQKMLDVFPDYIRVQITRNNIMIQLATWNTIWLTENLLKFRTCTYPSLLNGVQGAQQRPCILNALGFWNNFISSINVTRIWWQELVRIENSSS